MTRAGKKEDTTSTKSDEGSRNGKYAIMELDASWKMSSQWSERWTNPRLDSSTGFHNSADAASSKKDFWIEIEMKK
jgi:hypothetical protein